jgi:carbon-monoxide dehydrogenase medium subunit
MKAAAFDYRRARSLSEALEWLAAFGDTAKLVAGGQSLLPAMNLRLLAPDMLIDIGGVPELKGMTVEGEVLRIGAGTRHAELLASPLVAEHAPLLSRAIRHVAHPAIRNRGTIGGNLAHADPASELPACMLALDAVIVVVGPGGERRIAARDFFLGIYETALRRGDILIAVEVPVLGAGEVDWFSELSRRSGDYAIVGLACRARVEGERVRAIRLAYFGCGDRATLAESAAGMVAETTVTEDLIVAAKQALAHDLDPQDDPQASAATRLHLARVLLGRCIADVTGPSAREALE